jgi:hypothetical protein
VYNEALNPLTAEEEIEQILEFITLEDETTRDVDPDYVPEPHRARRARAPRRRRQDDSTDSTASTPAQVATMMASPEVVVEISEMDRMDTSVSGTLCLVDAYVTHHNHITVGCLSSLPPPLYRNPPHPSLPPYSSLPPPLSRNSPHPSCPLFTEHLILHFPEFTHPIFLLCKIIRKTLLLLYIQNFLIIQ